MKHEQIENFEDDAIVVVKLTGQFIGGDETDALQQLLIQSSTQHEARIIIDFTDVTYVNSGLIGVLLSVNATSLSHGGVIAICCMNDVLRQVFDLTKMHLIFNEYESVSQAKQALTVS